MSSFDGDKALNRAYGVGAGSGPGRYSHRLNDLARTKTPGRRPGPLLHAAHASYECNDPHGAMDRRTLARAVIVKLTRLLDFR